MTATQNGQDPFDIIKQLGESYRKIRFGGGIVGKTSYIMAAVVGVWAISAWRLSENLLLDCFLLAMCVLSTAAAMWYIRSTHNFAERNPAQALMEGAELLEYKKFEAQTKDQLAPSSGAMIEDPTKQPRIGKFTGEVSE